MSDDYKVMLVLEMSKQEAVKRLLDDDPDADPDVVDWQLFGIVRDYGTVVYKGREASA